MMSPYFDYYIKLGSCFPVCSSDQLTTNTRQPPPAILLVAVLSCLQSPCLHILREEKFSGHGLYISLRASREITHI